MQERCEVFRLGTIDYERAWELQNQLAGEIAHEERAQALLLLQHPHTYTFGRSGHAENLLWDEQERERRGISVHWVDRGGDVTYHGPGQLVAYPLIRLANSGLKVDVQAGKVRLPQADYVGYLRKLEETLILALQWLGVPSRQMEGLTGVWVQPNGSSPSELAKIAAIGVKVDVHGISRHGFALNVHPDMAYWQGIVGCGLKDHPVTSLAQLMQEPPSVERMQTLIIQAFAQVFNFQMQEKQQA
jgi:lipoyl(octanoyl) transferase